ncbi:MAG TPA: hypothetical protein DD640_01575, partial [Clostridiales bacterium]|nr:hypothetical protein [Clostridiales bacterium]
MVHHLGMSLTAIGNFLQGNRMQSRFHQEPMVQAAEILLEEIGSAGLIAVYRRWYTITSNVTETGEEATESRYCLGADPEMPVAHVMANQHYQLLLTSDGEGFSQCDGFRINRWRPDSRGGGYGSFIYLRDLNSGQIWSSAYRPTRKEPDSYQVVFAPDKVEYNRRDGAINTQTEITVSPQDNLEVRRVIVSNNAEKPVSIEVTSYLEAVADSFMADAAHPAFSRLFIETEYIGARRLLIAHRRKRSPGDPDRFVLHGIRVKGGLPENVEYEIDRRL